MELYDKFLENQPSKKLQKGEIILHQGDRPTVAYMVKSGIIKTYDINKEGEVKIISFESRYETFPIAWIFNKSISSFYYYEAFTDCELATCSKEEYKAFLFSSKDVTEVMFDMYVGRYLDFSRRINALTQLKAEDKVLYTLDFLCRRFKGNNQNLKKVRILLPISQQEFANIVGLTRETVSTVMNNLRRKRVVKYRGIEGLEVNIEKIEELTSIG